MGSRRSYSFCSSTAAPGNLRNTWGRSLRVVTQDCLYVSKARDGCNDALTQTKPNPQHYLTLIRGRLPCSIIEGLDCCCRRCRLPSKVIWRPLCDIASPCSCWHRWKPRRIEKAERRCRIDTLKFEQRSRGE